jgi:hypothetical protein
MDLLGESGEIRGEDGRGEFDVTRQGQSSSRSAN